MNDMLERVAAAMLDADFDVGSWRHADENIKDRFRAMARAAIAAMREPTKAMIDAGETAGNPVYEPRVIWGAMIDEALADKQDS